MTVALEALLPRDLLAAFCARWGVVEVAVFGSALRPDFRAQGPRPSGVDVLVTYRPDASPSLADEVRMQRELAQIAGRPVDMVSRRAIEASRNPLRKREILSTARVLIASRASVPV